jgi:tRNA threonylcarbamoyladenosine biosynthesis protein TsaB
MEARFLLIETSGKVGQVGLGVGNRLLAGAQLDLQHRHNRDLAPAVASLLEKAGWQPRELDGVIVSCGPGSYTGLRVGIMSAKAFAYATNCQLFAVDTFTCVVRQAPAEVGVLDVIVDAQRGNVYAQSFERDAARRWQKMSEPTVEPYEIWRQRRNPIAWVTGPGLQAQPRWREGLANILPEAFWVPRLEALLEAGLEKESGLSTADRMALEPLYLRPSSAEQKWDELGRP